MQKFTNATLDSVAIGAISSGVATILLDGDQWVRNLIIGIALVLVGMGVSLLKYKMRK
jgi:hypothetical protein